MSEVKKIAHTIFTSWWQSFEILNKGKMQIAQEAFSEGYDAQRLRADTAEAELHHLREQLKERDEIIENLNDRHDLGVQERDRLRSKLSAEKALRLENQRIIPVRFKCLACGDYHEGSGNVPCPKMSPYAALNLNPEAESHE